MKISDQKDIKQRKNVALKTDMPLNKEKLYSIWHMKISDQKDIKQRKNDALKTDMPLNKEKCLP